MFVLRLILVLQKPLQVFDVWTFRTRAHPRPPPQLRYYIVRHLQFYGFSFVGGVFAPEDVLSL